MWLPHGQLWAIKRGGSLTHLMLIAVALHLRPEGHQGPCNEAASEAGPISPAEHVVEFEPGTFRF